MKCKSCGKYIMSDGTFEQKLIDMKEDLEDQIDRLSTKMNQIKYDNTKQWKFDKLKAIRVKRNTQLMHINKTLKSFRHEMRELNRGIEEYLVKLLICEMKKAGYIREDFKRFREIAIEQYEKANRNSQEQIRIIQGKSQIKSKHNEWHTDNGDYDPVAKIAIDNIMKGD